MFKQIKNNIALLSVIAPVYAALELKPQGDDFSSLEKVTAPSIISGAISLVLIITILVFFFILIMGGFKWLTGGGDEKKISEARSQITNGLTGLLIIFSVWAILRIIGTLFDIDMFNLSIPSFTGASTSSPMLKDSTIPIQDPNTIIENG
jgi:hypothetical protein